MALRSLSQIAMPCLFHQEVVVEVAAEVGEAVVEVAVAP